MSLCRCVREILRKKCYEKCYEKKAKFLIMNQSDDCPHDSEV